MNCIVTAGSDYLSVKDDPIPGFDFGPPIGPVRFKGRPIGNGNTHTVRQRLEEAHLPLPGSSDTIPIEIMSISLDSRDPISVNGRLFDVHVRTTAGKRSLGKMTIIRDDSDGPSFKGTFLYSVHKFFTADFMPVDGGEGAFSVSSSLILGTEKPGTWTSDPDPSHILVEERVAELRANRHTDLPPNVVDFFFTGEVFEGRAATADVVAAGGMVMAASKSF